MSFEATIHRLSDVINIIGGGTPKRKVQEYWNGNIPWLSVVDFNTNNRFVDDTAEKITELGLQESSTKLLEAGQLIISARGTVGCLAQLTTPMAFNQSCYGLYGKKSILNNDYLYYLMCMKVTELRQKTHGAVFDTITRETFDHIEVQIPALNTQKRIANILGGFDFKIKINHQINHTLEQMAQAIFKSWFVDFEPVKAKIAALEAGGSEDDALLAAMQAIASSALFATDVADADAQTQLARLQAEHPERYATLRATAELFPSAMQESELGEVPEGWEAKPFGELLIKTIGGDWGKEEPDEKHTEKVKILRGTDLPHVYAGSDDKVPTRYVDPKKLATRKLENGDIVIEVSGGSPTQPTGRSLYLTQEIINRLNADLEPASFCRLFRPESKEAGLILGLHLQKIYGEGKTWLYQNTSTGISNFQTKMFLEKELIVLPPLEMQASFYTLVMPYLQKISSAENKVLAELRDVLLPKLLSGELSLAATEEQLADTVEPAHV